MERNLQEERFTLFKKRALSTKLFFRLFVFRPFPCFLVFIYCAIMFFFEMENYKIFYKTQYEETHTTKGAPSGVSSNNNFSSNGKKELIFQYSFTAEDGNVYTGAYKTFDYDYLNKKEFAVVYNVKEPEFSKVLNEEEDSKFFREKCFFLVFLLVPFFLILVWLLRKSLKQRKLLLKGHLARGVLVKFQEKYFLKNKKNFLKNKVVNELVYMFKTKDEKIYECKALTSIPPSDLALTCQNWEEISNLTLFADEGGVLEIYFEAHVLYLPDNPSDNCLFAVIPSELQLDQFGVFR